MGRSFGKTVVYWVNCFLAGDALIDTGSRWNRDELLRALEGREIRTIVNTHRHEDHIANNAAVAALSGARIVARPEALPTLKDPRSLKLRFYQREVWGWPQPSSADPIGDCVPAGPFTLNVIHTPGHVPDHVCLHEPEQGWLFTGDMFCGRKFKYLRAEEDFNTILNSLKTLHRLEFHTIFCSLFGAVENAREALGDKIQAMENLRADVQARHEKGLPPKAIAAELLGKEGFMKLVTGGHYSLENTVNSIITGRPKVIIQ